MVTLPGLSTTRVSDLVGSFWLTSVTLGALIRTTWLLVPVTLYFATWVAPVQVMLALVQLNTPALLIAMVAPDQAPGPSTIVPRSRSWTHLRVSGFTTVALTVATVPGAARAGAAAITAAAANALAVKPRRAG